MNIRVEQRPVQQKRWWPQSVFERNVFLPRTRSSSHGAIPSAVLFTRSQAWTWPQSTVNTASYIVKRQSDLVFKAGFRVLDVQR